MVHSDCPAGTFGDGITCDLCPVGEYQDAEGEAACIACESGFTTLTEVHQVLPNASQYRVNVKFLFI